MDTAVCTLESLSKRSRQLFTLPTVAMEVLDLTANREVDVGRIREAIEKDPALVAKLLRVVNSSLFCAHGVVRDLQQALTLIGLNPLRLLVLGFCLPDRLLKGIAEDVLAWYWRQTLTKAVAAREFAASACPVLADEVFVSGLLRDIGMLLLIQELDKPYLKLINQAVSSGRDVREIEQKAMGFDHVQLSHKMMEGWGLPGTLQVHEGSFDPSEFDAEAPEMTPRLLYVADLTAELLASGKTCVLPKLLEESQRLLRLDESCSEAILDSIEEKVRQLADVLSLKIPENLNYQSLLATARDRLIVAADEAAGNLVLDDNRDAESVGTSPQLKEAIEQDILRKTTKPGRDARQAASRKPDTKGSDSKDVGAASPARLDRQADSQSGRDSREVEPEQSGFAGIDTDSLAADIHASCEAYANKDDTGEPAATGETPSAETAARSATAASRRAAPSTSRPASPEASLAGKASDEEETPLFKQLRTATAACHRLRCPASLLAVDFNTDLETLGADNETILKELLRLACQTSCGDQKILLEFEKNGRAVILLNTERDEAVSMAHEVLESFKHAIPFCFGTNAPDVAIDLGIVTLPMPPADYDPNRFLDAVKRCLYASHASGGNRVKSVDIG